MGPDELPDVTVTIGGKEFTGNTGEFPIWRSDDNTGQTWSDIVNDDRFTQPDISVEGTGMAVPVDAIDLSEETDISYEALLKTVERCLKSNYNFDATFSFKQGELVVVHGFLDSRRPPQVFLRDRLKHYRKMIRKWVVDYIPEEAGEINGAMHVSELIHELSDIFEEGMVEACVNVLVVLGIAVGKIEYVTPYKM